MKDHPQNRERNAPDTTEIDRLVPELWWELDRYIKKSPVIDHYAIRLQLALVAFREERARY
jgi:hypothetical protein